MPLRVWLKALRLPFLTATIIPVMLGSILAWRESGIFSTPHFIFTLLSITLIHLGANLSNDYFDYCSTNDLVNRGYNAFSGGSRVLADALLKSQDVARAAGVMYGCGLLCGLLLALNLQRPGIAFFILVGVFAGYAYTAPPLKFAYRGLGELLNGIAFGPLIAVIAYLAQTSPVSLPLLAASVIPGLLLALLLLINEFPDFEADAISSKRTLVVRLGKSSALRLFGAGIVAVFLYLPLLVIFGILPHASLVALATFPVAAAAAFAAAKYLYIPSRFRIANALTYLLHGLFGLFLCIGLITGSIL